MQGVCKMRGVHQNVGRLMGRNSAVELQASADPIFINHADILRLH